MSFLDLAGRRQSVRSYKEDPVERAKIEKCLEAARLAPSACNSQPWKFVVVDDPDLKNAVARQTFGKLVSFNKFTLKAPVLIAIVTENPKFTAQVGGILKDKSYYTYDIGASVENLCLQAVEEGLGTCILGWFDEDGVKKLLGIPKDKRVDLLISVGYPESVEVRPKSRKDLNEIITYNKY
jgi:nitroreductase